MAFLRIYLNDDLQQQIELTGDTLTVGRSSDNDVVLNSPGVSAHHATIKRTENTFSVEDNDSTNGVYVNGDKIKWHKLKYWDEIQIYNYVLKYMASARARNDLEEVARDETANDMGTIAVSINNISDLRVLQQLGNDAYLQLLEEDGSESIHRLTSAVFTIGSAPTCNLQIRSWLAPKIASQIEKRGRDYYLIPFGWSKVTLNGNRISEPAILQENDFIGTSGLRLRFHLPTVKKKSHPE